MYVLAALMLAMLGTAQAAPPAAVWEWQASDGMEKWEANHQIVDIAQDAAGVTFRTSGGDPIMTYRPLLDVRAHAWQAFEVRLKADRDGQIELFWTQTTEGPFGGFSQDKVTRFGVKGDGAWRTYRVFPFWQRAGKIVKLRFDPYGGARFTVATMRIVEWPVPDGAGPALRMPRDSGRMAILHEVKAASSPDGLRLARSRTDGFALAPVSGVDADELASISVELSAAGATRAALVFASDQVFGLHEMPLQVVAGRRRVYNLDGLAHPSWKGRIIAAGIRPGAGVTLHSLRIADKPQGPADLRIQSFDAEEALPRVGRTVTLAARVSNAGGEPAKSPTLIFQLPPGCRAASPSDRLRVTLPAVRYGEERTATCRVVFARAGTHPVSLRAVLGGKSVTSARCAVAVTPGPQVAMSGAPPEPRPVRGKIDIGVYYFPGWRTPGQWAPITRYPERRPVLGWYREGDPSIADWHVKWAVEHGITFFAFDWYWSAGARSLEHALHDGLFNSRFGRRLQFCLLWANHNAPETSSHEDFLAVVRYWIDHYFKRPEHYTIDGKPVVIIFTPHRFRADMGPEAVRKSFDAMRDECRKAGLPGLYLIACVGGDVQESRAAADEGYDAVTAYNWPGLGVKGNEREAPFADLLEPYRRQWERLVEAGPLPLMTPVSGGWDSRPWHGDTALVRSNRTPTLFRKHLEDARQFIESHPGKALPVALIEAWNEFGEGSYIEPHREYGFQYLDAIRTVFTDAPAAHMDLTPEDVGHKPPQVNVEAAMRGEWDLTRDASGWDSGMNLTDFRMEDGALHALTTGNDPAFLGPPMQVQAASHRTLVLRMRLAPPDGSPSEENAQVFWTTRSSPTSEAASVRFPVRMDGQWHEYRVKLGGNVRWRGVITGLRLDPCNRASVTVALSRVAIE